MKYIKTFEKFAEQDNCKGCGAALDPKKDKCDYCGNPYKVKKEEPTYDQGRRIKEYLKKYYGINWNDKSDRTTDSGPK